MRGGGTGQEAIVVSRGAEKNALRALVLPFALIRSGGQQQRRAGPFRVGWLPGFHPQCPGSVSLHLWCSSLSSDWLPGCLHWHAASVRRRARQAPSLRFKRWQLGIWIAASGRCDGQDCLCQNTLGCRPAWWGAELSAGFWKPS